MTRAFTADEQWEIDEIVRLGSPYDRERNECEARQLILMRDVPETDYCLIPLKVSLPQVWIGNEQVSWLWDNS